ncbi:hypothetical protein OEZ85_013003 [Tetradesmus obliquus]|uniref:SGNH domain-containing protein n=1 Tax=Tetradesmus obliquus TaxID=3088 RepID=A0ABY8U4X3_TETOB|nr:hypothetical protein OEZ85_013003 [Tetradesmus obliquus]
MQRNSKEFDPLLLGGVYDRCESGCQPRTDTWSDMCKADPDELSTINVCERSQRQSILEVADVVSSGAISAFSPCELHSFLGNRTLWLVGDSHTKNTFTALRCFMLDFWDHSQGECQASSIALLQQQLEKAALRGHIYNTPPRCLHLIGGGRICLVHSPMGTTLLNDDPYDPGTLQLLHSFFAAAHDIFYISFGRWHSNNCDGVDASYADALEALGGYLQDQRPTFPNVFFAAPLHDHTSCTNGAFNDSLGYCLPATEGGYPLEFGKTLQRAARDILTVKYGVPLISSYQASLMLHDGHVLPRQTIAGRVDCLHYCRPGMPEIEIWTMAQTFAAHNISRGVMLPSPPVYSHWPSPAATAAAAATAM